MSGEDAFNRLHSRYRAATATYAEARKRADEARRKIVDLAQALTTMGAGQTLKTGKPSPNISVNDPRLSDFPNAQELTEIWNAYLAARLSLTVAWSDIPSDQRTTLRAPDF